MVFAENDDGDDSWWQECSKGITRYLPLLRMMKVVVVVAKWNGE